MKKLLVITLIATCLGCAKKSKVTPTNPVVGKWYNTKTTQINYHADGNDTTYINYNHTDYIQFNADGTGSQWIEGQMRSFTYTFSATSIVFSFAPSNVPNALNVKSLTTTTIALITTQSLDGILQTSNELDFAK